MKVGTHIRDSALHGNGLNVDLTCPTADGPPMPGDGNVSRSGASVLLGASQLADELQSEFRMVYSFEQMEVDFKLEHLLTDPKLCRKARWFAQRLYPKHEQAEKEAVARVQEEAASSEANRLKWVNSFTCIPSKPILTFLVLKAALCP